MESLADIFKKSGNLHHAYILEGEREVIREPLLLFIQEKLKHPTQGNPDFWHERHDSFSIEQARNLREVQMNKAFSEGRKIFVLETSGITVEAQNALLKVFEEPTPMTHFFIIMPSVETLLPTLRSRVQILKGEYSASAKSAKEFLARSPAERIAYVADIIEDKDKHQALALVQDLISFLGKDPHKNSASLAQIFDVRKYLNDRSASLKLLLEHLSLTV